MSTHGGARNGAGRKKGGASKLDQAARKKALEQGISPLDYLLSVMRCEAEETARRVDAAKAAAPYVHARLVAAELSGPGGVPLSPPVIQIMLYADDPPDPPAA